MGDDRLSSLQLLHYKMRNIRNEGNIVEDFTEENMPRLQWEIPLKDLKHDINKYIGAYFLNKRILMPLKTRCQCCKPAGKQ
jgi:hypothetical protein